MNLGPLIVLGKQNMADLNNRCAAAPCHVIAHDSTFRKEDINPTAIQHGYCQCRHYACNRLLVQEFAFFCHDFDFILPAGLLTRPARLLTQVLMRRRKLIASVNILQELDALLRCSLGKAAARVGNGVKKSGQACLRNLWPTLIEGLQHDKLRHP